MSTYAVTATIDSTMSGIAGEKDDNFGATETLLTWILIIGGSKSVWTRMILNFDLSGYPGEADGSDITLVTLTLDAGIDTGGSYPGDQIHFRRCIRPTGWPEDEVTWNEFASGSSWTAGGGDTEADDQVIWEITSGFDIKVISDFTGLTRDALVDRGDILSIIGWLNDESDGGSTRGIIVASSEHLTGTLPTLTITYGAAISGDPQNFRRQVIL